MYQPEVYGIALLFMIISMLCWGSWANTMKLCSGYRFQLFYWDYVIGLIVGAVVWGGTLGSFGSAGRSFLSDITHAGLHPVVLAVAGGVIFNIANLLLVAAIDIAGLAVAFPIGIGLALVVGAIGSYLVSPQGNPLLLFGGIALVVTAIVLDAMAYRLREANRAATSRRGIVVSLIAGVLMGCFYPFVSKAMTGENAPGPYAVLFFFVMGVAACSIPVNYLLMRMPLDGREAASGERREDRTNRLAAGVYDVRHAFEVVIAGRPMSWLVRLTHNRGIRPPGFLSAEGQESVKDS